MGWGGERWERDRMKFCQTSLRLPLDLSYSLLFPQAFAWGFVISVETRKEMSRGNFLKTMLCWLVMISEHSFSLRKSPGILGEGGTQQDNSISVKDMRWLDTIIISNLLFTIVDWDTPPKINPTWMKTALTIQIIKIKIYSGCLLSKCYNCNNGSLCWGALDYLFHLTLTQGHYWHDPSCPRRWTKRQSRPQSEKF